MTKTKESPIKDSIQEMQQWVESEYICGGGVPDNEIHVQNIFDGYYTKS